MKTLDLKEMEVIEGGSWFSQIFGRDWQQVGDCYESPSGEMGRTMYGHSWLWGDRTIVEAC